MSFFGVSYFVGRRWYSDFGSNYEVGSYGSQEACSLKTGEWSEVEK